jgi:parallel beta-helix repeat protein
VRMKKQVGGFAVLAIAWGSVVVAGPLTPPAGPIVGTHKTLTEVEPRVAISQPLAPANGSAMIVISQSGSYYLASNIVATTGFQGSGIVVSADDVTLDLNGFSIVGSGVGNSVSSGISCASNTGKRLSIRNGKVRGWAGSGIDAKTSGGSNAVITEVHASDNGGSGFSVSEDSVLTRCTSTSNTEHGFHLGTSNTVTDCTADNNGSSGFRVGLAGSLRGCTARFNTQYGFSGNATNSFLNCVARQNSGGGFSVSAGAVLEGCIADTNGSVGFHGDGNGSTLTGCSAYDNGGTGFSFTGATTIANCTAFSNGQHGVLVTSGSTVTGGTFRGNTVDGIRASTNCTILNNTCTANTGAGILVTGSSGTRVEGNTVTNNGTGVSVSGGAIVVRNTASKNPATGSVGANDFVSSGTNAIGQIFDVTAGATITTSNSFANFKY